MVEKTVLTRINNPFTFFNGGVARRRLRRDRLRFRQFQRRAERHLPAHVVVVVGQRLDVDERRLWVVTVARWNCGKANRSKLFLGSQNLWFEMIRYYLLYRCLKATVASYIGKNFATLKKFLNSRLFLGLFSIWLDFCLICQRRQITTVADGQMFKNNTSGHFSIDFIHFPDSFAMLN